MEYPTTLPPRCARQDGDVCCVHDGCLTCANCKLVLYCGSDCQRAHWPEHKRDCKSLLSKKNWLPDWDRSGREPAWASPEASRNLHNPFGSQKHLWGNTPALDVLKLADNEGQGYAKDISILFAASGDIRNVVRTMADLPEAFKNCLKVTMNDLEFDVVARNTVLLMFAIASIDSCSTTSTYDSVVEDLIHIWYSAFIPKTLLASFHSKVKPLLKDGWDSAVERDDGTVAKTWKFHRGSTLVLTLSPKDWLRLDSFLEVPDGLDFDAANRLRASIVLAPERADYRDRWDFKEANPHMRISKKRFREDGLLLPFGNPRNDYKIPNPTLFNTPDCWPMDDKADPLTGWPLMVVHQTPWKAANDCYGKLFVHLRSTLTAFLSRLAAVETHFELFNMNAKVLPRVLKSQSYARIEVSNITDVAYLGTHDTVVLLSPLLQLKENNPHATLITSYINAVMEIARMSGEANQMPDVEFLQNYIPDDLDVTDLLRQGARMYKVWDARPIAMRRDWCFKQYMKLQKFQQAAKDAEVIMKGRNTIVDAWPMSLRLRPGEVGAKEEFDLLLASNSTGVERYVEWKRA